MLNRLQYWDLRQPNPVATVQLPERCYTMDVQYPLLVVGTAERHIVVYNLTNPTAAYRVRSFTETDFRKADRSRRCNHHLSGKRVLCRVSLLRLGMLLVAWRDELRSSTWKTRIQGESDSKHDWSRLTFGFAKGTTFPLNAIGRIPPRDQRTTRRSLRSTTSSSTCSKEHSQLRERTELLTSGTRIHERG
jgi:hypothetical protein